MSEELQLCKDQPTTRQLYESWQQRWCRLTGNMPPKIRFDSKHRTIIEYDPTKQVA